MRARGGCRWPEILLLLPLFLLLAATPSSQEDTAEDAGHWMSLGRERVAANLDLHLNLGVGKSAILFVGDGMGLATITASRIFKGQLAGRPGEEGYLSFERWSNVGLLKTYNVDRQVPDSAGTATALFSGVKGRYYTVGLDSHAKYNTCLPAAEQERAKVTNILHWAMAAGKSTGLVTTTRVTHATPAAAYSHCPHRDWECDTKMSPAQTLPGCKDIARQLVEEDPGRSLNVVLAGGEQMLRAKVNETDYPCRRGDGKDLVWDWMKYQKAQGRRYRYIRTRDQLLEPTTSADVDHLLGLFAPAHLPYDKERTERHPSLSEMTSTALSILTRNPAGFVLIVEGGRIDHAHHDNLAKIALEETLAFEAAIDTALSLVQRNETLMIVTADHSHAMSINGYPKRGSPIGGVGDTTPEGYSYHTLSYINGPGYTVHRVQGVGDEAGVNATRKNGTLSSLNTWLPLGPNGTDLDRKAVHHAGYWMDSETHGGEDVPVYATGPMAHLLRGVEEQTMVAHTLAFSLCIGPYKDNCKRGGASGPAHCDHHNHAPSSTPLPSLFLLLFLVSLLLLLLSLSGHTH